MRKAPRRNVLILTLIDPSQIPHIAKYRSLREFWGELFSCHNILYFFCKTDFLIHIKQVTKHGCIKRYRDGVRPAVQKYGLVVLKNVYLILSRSYLSSLLLSSLSLSLSSSSSSSSSLPPLRLSFSSSQ
jgi:hypothetical protein